MKQIIDYQLSFKSQDIKDNVKEFLAYHKKEDVIAHSINVAKTAEKLAEGFNISPKKAYIAGLLHDISLVIPDEERLQLHQQLGKEVLAEEEKLPMILHQKQSVFIAEEVFRITDTEILSAIECHTTLKKDASDLDKIIFIADKIKWDRKHSAPYLEKLNKALEVSLDEGCRVYIEWALSDIVVLHPWLEEAMNDLEMNGLS